MQNASRYARLREARRRRWRNYVTVGLRFVAFGAGAQLLVLQGGAHALRRFARDEKRRAVSKPV